MMWIKWLTQKVKKRLRGKDKYLHPACKINKAVCSFGESYIGKTVTNIEVRWNGLNNPTKKSNLSKHVKDTVDRVFYWPKLAKAPTKMFWRIVLEMFTLSYENLCLMSNLSHAD